MRVAVMGAGALGGFYGGLMARAGEDVTFIARGKTLEALRDHGLTVKSRLKGDFTIPVTATNDANSLGAVDLVFFSVKSYDLDTAVQAIKPLVGPETMVLSVQNGIDNEQRIGKIVGDQAVIGGVVVVSSTVEAPGVIAQVGGPALVRFGEMTPGITPRVRRLKDLFDKIDIPAEALEDIRGPLWQKFMLICAMSGVCSLTRLTLQQIFAVPETKQFYRDVMAEVTAVARAQGVDLPESAADDALVAMQSMLATAERGSMAYDLMAGRRIEIETLNGTVVRLGRESGVATPYNFAIYASLKPFANGAP
ncbi:MAG TPA: 2-dehydropantoate 2-reductase [Thermomicrobiales bacterium]|nr:2-dehydropantoate 2-reductase [Thermomicrobiales bacterium]